MTRRWFRFRLRTILLLAAVLCGALALISDEVRHQQAYRQAWYDLAVLEMGSRIGYGVRFYSRRTSWSPDDVDELLRITKILGRRREFGFSSGMIVDAIDFKGSQISDESLERVRRAMPETLVRR